MQIPKAEYLSIITKQQFEVLLKIRVESATVD